MFSTIFLSIIWLCASDFKPPENEIIFAVVNGKVGFAIVYSTEMCERFCEIYGGDPQTVVHFQAPFFPSKSYYKNSLEAWCSCELPGFILHGD